MKCLAFQIDFIKTKNDPVFCTHKKYGGDKKYKS